MTRWVFEKVKKERWQSFDSRTVFKNAENWFSMKIFYDSDLKFDYMVWFLIQKLFLNHRTAVNCVFEVAIRPVRLKSGPPLT